jgi:hypothetical protein
VSHYNSSMSQEPLFLCACGCLVWTHKVQISCRRTSAQVYSLPSQSAYASCEFSPSIPRRFAWSKHQHGGTNPPLSRDNGSYTCGFSCRRGCCIPSVLYFAGPAETVCCHGKWPLPSARSGTKYRLRDHHPLAAFFSFRPLFGASLPLSCFSVRIWLCQSSQPTPSGDTCRQIRRFRFTAYVSP